MHQMALAETINQQVKEDDEQVIVDAGTLVSALIHNILGNAPVRLYQLERFFADKPLPLLFPWQPDLPLSALNEDRAGRVLDALWAAGPQKVFSAVSQKVIAQYQLGTNRIHVDSTSKSFYGAYEEQENTSAPQLSRGYSKDHRPDLVQLLFGVGATADGVVVYGDVADGNRQDMVANGHWITQLRQQLGLDDYDFLLYVADSAAVTEENLKLMRLFHLDVLSRLPARFGLWETLLAQAPRDLEQWEDLGVFGQSKQAAHYKAWETEAELVDTTYRFVVLWSDRLAAQHRRTLKRRLRKEWSRLEKALSDVEQQTFEQPGEAQVYWTAFLERQKLTYHQLEATVEAVTVTLPYPKPGRPPKGATRPTALRYRLIVTVTCDWQAYRAACQTHGKFILITSLRDCQAYPARDILAEYKEQYTAERAFRFIKDPTWVGAFCLKKPERIAAFAYVLLMAAMVYTLLERQVRQSLQPAAIEPIVGLNNRPTKQPTAYAIKTILTPILVVALFLDGQWSFRPSRPLTENQKRVLALAGFSEDIYYWQGEFKSEKYHSAPP